MAFRLAFNITLCLMFSLCLQACMTEIGPTNPYDPETPVEQQKKASVTLSVFGTMNVDGVVPSPLADAELLISSGASQQGTTV